LKPVITQYALKNCFKTEETAFFYNVQPNRTLALKEEIPGVIKIE
jgi:hypothetical protein